MTNERADFYIGRAEQHDDQMVWLGSVRNDGQPVGTNDHKYGVSYYLMTAVTVHEYLKLANEYMDRDGLDQRNPCLLARKGTAWPWQETSQASAWAYTYFHGYVWVSHFGSAWVKATDLYREVKIEAAPMRKARTVHEVVLPAWPEEKANFPDLRGLQVDHDALVPYGYNSTGTIMAVMPHDTLPVVALILERLKEMGDHGSSRAVDILDFVHTYFDGDGSDRIYTLLVNGMESDDWAKAYLNTGEQMIPVCTQPVVSDQTSVVIGPDLSANHQRGLLEQLRNIAEHGPVFAGDLIDKSAAKQLLIGGLITKDPTGDYILSTAGKVFWSNWTRLLAVDPRASHKETVK
ncbi:MAG: hypothetical protein WC505_06300 [Patescibacteria group bacterium]